MKLTGAEILCQTLERLGVTDLFGYPGGAILPVYDALGKSKLHHVLVRHEQGATHMADGYARASGGVGVAMAFAGETRTWPGGTPVKLIIRAPGAHEREVVLRLLRLSEDEYARYWTTQAYRGEGTEPVAVFSNGMQKEAVLAIPGAIAVMDARDLKPGLKVMKIEGKLPGEEGYPLH